MNKIFGFILVAVIFLSENISAQKNLTFRSNLKYPTALSGTGTLSNIWGFAKGGKEYALVGTGIGMSIVDVTNPDSPVELFAVNTVSSIWREVRTHGDFAYVTTEGGGGVSIVDLSNLPASIKDTVWTGDGAIANQINEIHALHIEDGFLYLYGGNYKSGGIVIADLSNPWNPNYVGEFENFYVHDGCVRNDTAWSGAILDGFFAVIDMSDKSNPTLLTTQNTPDNFTHNTWLSDDSKTLFTTDEVSGAFVASYDVTDISDIKELDRYQHYQSYNPVPHNTYVKNDWLVTSYYTEGVTIVDAHRPANMVEVGNYDCSPLASGDMDGDWGVYAFLPSGNLLLSDMQEGLFVLTPTYVRACYLEGIVTDSITGIPISGAKVEILATSVFKNSNLIGEYKTGVADSGTYSVQVSRAGYITKIIPGVPLDDGIVNLLNVKLRSMATVAFNGVVKDVSTQNTIQTAQIFLKGNILNYNFTTDANGKASGNILPDNYEIYIGKWGYKTNFVAKTISTTDSITVDLTKGYYDDFIFDYGWTVSNTATVGFWERGEPVGTEEQTVQANPDLDVPNDFGDQCFITGNGGGSVSDDDVDGGWTVLTSPVFDLTGYNMPFINYYRWFYNDFWTGLGNDTLKVILTNGTTSATIETVTAFDLNTSKWKLNSVKVSDFITPTANMQIIFETGDGSQHWLEAGVDMFQITDSFAFTNVIAKNGKENNFVFYPNPFSNTAVLQITNEDELRITKVELKIYDVLGREVLNDKLQTSNKKLDLSNLQSGIYFVKITGDNFPTQTLKIVKTK